MLGKKVLTILFVLAAFSRIVASYREKSSEEEWQGVVKKLKEYIAENNIQETSDKEIQTFGYKDFDIDFACRRSKPTSVHTLQPQDISVIGAMGDSLTAANGANATTIAGILREFRGVAWSAGGEGDAESVLTFPNILRLFNSDLKGYSLGTRFSEERDWTFNVAVPGAKGRDMPRQAKELLKRMQESTDIDFENDWKVVTIFVGGNDLCALNRSADAQPDRFIKFLQEGLDILHNGMKRTLVNLVNILEIHLLQQVAQGSGSTEECRWAQRFECRYVATADEQAMENIKEKNKIFQDLISSLVESGRYDTRDDFTVVLQPFLTNTTLPYTEDGEVDTSYFAPDCFHLSTKGHAMGAINLWNNMLEPVGQKTTAWSITDLKCPSEESPYFFTNLNSPTQQQKI